MDQNIKRSINKREFLKYSLMGLGSVAMAKLMGSNLLTETMTGSNSIPDPENSEQLWKWSKEAMFYTAMPQGMKCELCPNGCVVKPNDLGLCKTRKNYNGKLYTIAYGNPCSFNNDPIEKKPLFHFMPTTKAFSIATAGCTFACLNCQNWEISQISPLESKNIDMMPERVIENALMDKAQSVAYTYSEPIAFYEYVYDTAKLARAKGLKNLLISNGYINEKPLRNLCKVIDAANINLKSFDNDIYMKLNGGMLQPILNTLRIMKEEGVWLEITNLIVPTWTDNMDMFKRMSDWLYANGFKDNPLHILRFTPMHKLTQLPYTSVPVLEKARNIALNAGLKYVYIGNVPGHAGESTICPKCKKVLIERQGFSVTIYNIRNGACKFCNEKIAGVWG
jgi:pyruvate formate lyase activating enzyme